MKDEGWLFASHTWGHQNVSQISLERLQADTQKFKENVDPLIGGTDIIILHLEQILPVLKIIRGRSSNILRARAIIITVMWIQASILCRSAVIISGREEEIWTDTECTIIRNFSQICLMHSLCLILPDRCRFQPWGEYDRCA